MRMKLEIDYDIAKCNEEAIEAMFKFDEHARGVIEIVHCPTRNKALKEGLSKVVATLEAVRDEVFRLRQAHLDWVKSEIIKGAYSPKAVQND